eukprot:GHVU01064734.1.p1 GENE.GHVU01064734.1~~GHVU01064734.1.p1  ORF type:complete len:279 (-),score=19.50 GHVU01064734.1:788-1624(-)
MKSTIQLLGLLSFLVALPSSVNGAGAVSESSGAGKMPVSDASKMLRGISFANLNATNGCNGEELDRSSSCGKDAETPCSLVDSDIKTADSAQCGKSWYFVRAQKRFGANVDGCGSQGCPAYFAEVYGKSLLPPPSHENVTDFAGSTGVIFNFCGVACVEGSNLACVESTDSCNLDNAMSRMDEREFGVKAFALPDGQSYNHTCPTCDGEDVTCDSGNDSAKEKCQDSNECKNYCKYMKFEKCTHLLNTGGDQLFSCVWNGFQDQNNGMKKFGCSMAGG